MQCWVDWQKKSAAEQQLFLQKWAKDPRLIVTMKNVGKRTTTQSATTPTSIQTTLTPTSFKPSFDNAKFYLSLPAIKGPVDHNIFNVDVNGNKRAPHVTRKATIRSATNIVEVVQ